MKICIGTSKSYSTNLPDFKPVSGAKVEPFAQDFFLFLISHRLLLGKTKRQSQIISYVKLN
jgi:hypothetical protein